MNNERLAGIIIPDFLLELCYQRQPDRRLQPVALTENDQPAAPIIARNSLAAENRVACKMTVLQARALCPDLVVAISENDKAVRQSQKIRRELQTIAPLVEETTPGAYFMEISGVRRLYGSEKQIAQRIIARIKALGYPVTVGIADQKFVARVAAETSEANNFTVVKKGGCTTFVAGLDITHLRLSADTLEKLRELGLKKIGQLTFFPTNEMSTRFGIEGSRLSQLSHGRDMAQLLREWPEEALSNEISLTYRIYNTATIIRHTEKLLRPLFGKLQPLGLGCHRLEIILMMEDRSHESLTLSVSQPTLAIKRLTRQLHHHLEKTKLAAGVIGLKINITQNSVALLPSQQVTIDNKPSATVGSKDPELDKLLVDHQVCLVNFNSALLPEQSFTLGSAASRKKTNACESDHTPLYPTDGLRLLQSPRATDIVTEQGLPSLITSGRTPQPIDRHYGPWQVSGGWWNADFDRLYYQMQTLNQRRYLFFFDRLNKQWYLHGIFD